MMKLILIFFYSLPCFSLDFNRVDDQIMMTTDDCSVGENYLQQIVNWSTTLDANLELTSCVPRNINGKCETNITQCLPERVRDIHGVEPLGKGPNCWNLVLWLNNMTPNLRWTSADEMTHFMSSSLCRPLGPNESRLPGDIIAIKSNTPDKENGGVITEEYHGMIYISEDLVFSKDSLSNHDEYSITLADDIYNEYYVESARCRQNNNDVNCFESADFFRCDLGLKIDDVIQSTSPKIREALDALDHYESCVEESKFSGGFLNDETSSLVDNVISILEDYSKDEVAEQANSNDAFILNTMRLRVSALRNSFNTVNDDRTSERLEVLEQALYR